MTNSILNGGDPTNTASALETLVGEGKKFKTIEDLAKGKLEADRFIEKLSSEQEQLRKELEARMALEEQLARHAAGASGQPAPTSVPPANQPSSTPTVDVDKLLDEKLAKRAEFERQSQNTAQVDNFLLQHFGDAEKAREAVAKLNATLGIDMKQIASVSPEAAIRLIRGEAGPVGSAVAERGMVRTGVTSQGEVRNNAYYSKLRAEMGNARFYTDKKLQLQLHKDAQSLGDKFFE